MSLIFEIVICVIAGCGAGLGIGFAGMSAAAVISPMLITFLGYKPYLAVGVALASDVLASSVSAITYGKNKNIDIKNGIIMMIAVLVFTLVGSYVSKLVPDKAMGGLSTLMTLLMGIKFLTRPVMTSKDKMATVSAKRRLWGSIIFGILIGFVCGFVGAGGGMMMLLVLTSILGYELKTAVGTSLFIMAFTALTGAGAHFAMGGAPNWLYLGVCVVVTLIMSQLASKFANKSDPKTLNKTVGIVLTVMGAAMLLFQFIPKKH